MGGTVAGLWRTRRDGADAAVEGRGGQQTGLALLLENLLGHGTVRAVLLRGDEELTVHVTMRRPPEGSRSGGARTA